MEWRQSFGRKREKRIKRMCKFSPLKDKHSYSVSKYDILALLRLIAAIIVSSERRAIPGGRISLSSVVMEGIHPENEGTGLLSSSRKGRFISLSIRDCWFPEELKVLPGCYLLLRSRYGRLRDWSPPEGVVSLKYHYNTPIKGISFISVDFNKSMIEYWKRNYDPGHCCPWSI